MALPPKESYMMSTSNGTKFSAEGCSCSSSPCGTWRCTRQMGGKDCSSGGLSARIRQLPSSGAVPGGSTPRLYGIYKLGPSRRRGVFEHSRRPEMTCSALPQARAPRLPQLCHDYLAFGLHNFFSPSDTAMKSLASAVRNCLRAR